MINEVLSLMLALVAGSGLGVIFFGGLWLTLLNLPTTRRPLLLTLGSLAGRMGIALLGFYLIMDGSWQRLIACVLGFFLVRQVFIRWLKPAPAASVAVEQQ
jgi:F1F0 ATPase subunit 2